METVDELCGILDDFKRMMADFGVESWRACATSSLRELENPVIILEQIFQRTGIRVEILSNAEQHFLGYKSIAAIESGFKKAIQKGTAILDIGGGNLQISLFDKDALVLTQSIRMGSLRIRERLKELEKTTPHYDRLIEEFIRNDLTAFQRLYLKDRDIKNVILMGDFLTDTMYFVSEFSGSASCKYNAYPIAAFLISNTCVLSGHNFIAYIKKYKGHQCAFLLFMHIYLIHF